HLSTSSLHDALPICQQRSENGRRELRFAPHQIILVAAKRGPCVMVHIVLDEGDAVLRAERNKRRLQQVVSGELVSHEIMQMQTLDRKSTRLNSSHEW